ncbi:MAG TPA: ion channel [Candidatus Polarisedimenticolia bacterium]|nr:ion channel [Candidatus Polarisedimenticolia bacterium]
MNSFKRRAMSFWDEDRGLTLLMVLLAVISFIAAPLAHAYPGGDTLLSALVSLLFVFGAFVVQEKRSVGLIVAALAIAPIVLEWAAHLHPTLSLKVAGVLASLLFVSYITWHVIRRVLRQGTITVHRIIGAMAAYLLLGFAFAEAGRLLDLVVPGSYTAYSGGGDKRIDLYYFSFVTLTTVGYGDVLPIHPLARSLAVLEALTGQLFPAILIARLVAQELTEREAKRR